MDNFVEHINTFTHGQLEDFRASLKMKDSSESSEGEIPVKSIAKAKQEKMKRRKFGVSGGEGVRREVL